jgi:hypothetical protein
VSVAVEVRVDVAVEVGEFVGPACVWTINCGALTVSSLLPKLIAVLPVVMSPKL